MKVLFSSNSDHQLNFSNNCLKAHSINLIFYGDGKNLYEYSILWKYLKTKSEVWLMFFKNLENWYLCAPRNNSEHLYRYSLSLLKVELIKDDLKQTERKVIG